MIAILKEKLYKKGFFHLLSTNFLVQFLGFGSTLVVAKLVTVEELGNIKLLQSYAGIFAVVAGFGLSTALLKFSSETEDDSTRAAIFAASLRNALFATLGTLLVGAVLALMGLLSSNPSLRGWMVLYSLVVPSAVATNLMITFLQSQKRLHSLAKAQALVRSQSFLAVILATWIWGFPGFVAATVISMAVGLVPLIREVGGNAFSSASERLPAGFFRISAFTLVSSLVSTAGQYADIFILDHFSVDRKELGYYALATLFIMACSQVINTIQQFLSPYFCRRSGDAAWFRASVMKAQLATTLFSAVLALAVFALGWTLVRYVFGGEYASTLDYLSVLLLRFVIWSGYAVSGGVAIFALGKVGLDFIRSLVSVVVGTACSFILLQKYGIVGVAWGQVFGAAAALIISIVMANFIFRARHGTGPGWSAAVSAGQT